MLLNLINVFIAYSLPGNLLGDKQWTSISRIHTHTHHTWECLFFSCHRGVSMAVGGFLEKRVTISSYKKRNISGRKNQEKNATEWTNTCQVEMMRN